MLPFDFGNPSKLCPMTVQGALVCALEGRDLTMVEAGDAMAQLMLGEVHHGLMGGFLVGMQMKGVTGDELAGFAKSMRSFAVGMPVDVETLVDTCGTGGGTATFNLSTGAAILAASCGAKVAKHGNRAVTSHCGSADVLERLGVPIEGTVDQLRGRLDRSGFLFLFAPNFHPAVRHVAPVRKALGVRTVFNLLGPLANPAGAKRQMVGVYDPANMVPMAEALVKLGVEDAFVVHGSDGMDEVSPVADTFYIRARGGTMENGTWKPEDFGVSGVTAEELVGGGSADDAAEILKSALSGSHRGRSEALVPNTAVTLVLAGLATDVAQGAEMARAALAEGRALETLRLLAE